MSGLAGLYCMGSLPTGDHDPGVFAPGAETAMVDAPARCRKAGRARCGDQREGRAGPSKPGVGLSETRDWLRIRPSEEVDLLRRIGLRFDRVRLPGGRDVMRNR